MATVMATPGLQRSGFCIKSRKCLKGRAAWKGERSQFGPMGVGEGWESGGGRGGKSSAASGTVQHLAKQAVILHFPTSNTDVCF